MKIAIPVADGKLDLHFGHCKNFALLDVNLDTKKIVSRNDVDAPPHEPGLLPAWLGDKNVELVISGGMGQKAKQLFEARSIQVVVGAPSETPELLVQAYLGGRLTSGVNACDH
ncbi:ATPase [Vibrio sp. V27_P1S3P104]|uniref:NifB/NifX family molybdenum-iron cluster-binding protein n=1 Tax=unclassified Vibrio TaxID=2614977 RepID=UPI0013731BC0|nr:MULTISPECIES: NifB/NifX family molybdenum-iron cluster-binding protein [unclassified Vibrio]NAW69721.1 ATPase [Vibrio sp. V28_P6S34P95]NAX06286.1 ATPase [Vibrio sp. V30_P3S12P165]NAX34885.1 ATPase [Vibrio sp. V29_P1S30P107]NAX37903.1 ATPase [Vibrio sp. V27_P1S3P104]NAX40879.1 ATPase [Vibrio sp. V26_P1S5P106]